MVAAFAKEAVSRADGGVMRFSDNSIPQKQANKKSRNCFLLIICGFK